jgi:UDP-N-acetylglucosamine 1-carboxyvinyltransferase
MGANITIAGDKAVVVGVPMLKGAQVMASDIRAGAALVLAGLAAQGDTTVSRVYHIDRGYNRLERDLASLGAVIERVVE